MSTIYTDGDGSFRRKPSLLERVFTHPVTGGFIITVTLLAVFATVVFGVEAHQRNEIAKERIRVEAIIDERLGAK